MTSRHGGRGARGGETVVGVGTAVPTHDGRSVPYVHLDNAGMTPAFREVVDAVNGLLPYLASVRGGSGFATRVCTEVLDEARETVAAFVGADPDRDTVVFTESIADAMTLVDGAVAVAAVSDVSGAVEPVHELAARAHGSGRRILVDATHLAAHRRIAVGRHHDLGHLDFVAICGDRLYAPFGAAALIGRRDQLVGEPDTTNLLGIVALATAVRTLDELGREWVARHEAALLDQATERLARVPGVRLVAPAAGADRVGIVSLAVDGVDPGLVAAVLDHEHGVGAHCGRDALRISFGCYNDPRDVHRLVGALHRIAAGDLGTDYRCDAEGVWRMEGDVSSVA